MTTRPGFVWDATASEWVEIGQAAVLAPVKYQATAPTSPATGDIWIESDVDVPSIDISTLLGNLKIKQIVSGSTTTETFSSSTTYADTTLTATITPTSASNKIVVMYQQGSIRKSGGNLNSALDLKLVRNSTDLAFHYALYTATALELRVPGPGGIVIDSPASTSALTYKTQFRNGGAFDGVAVQIQNSRGSIILIEVEGL
jgi:hypothetical protein